jgi:GntR family transcriptional regulator/MocR family aminotransferase
MTSHTATAWLLLDRSAGNLEQQIHHGIRERILDGRLKRNDRLPSSRSLAISLRVARSTVAGAYERLRTEGFIEAARGSSTRVAALPAPPQGARGGSAPPSPKPRPEPERFLPFRPGLPDLDSFPHTLWARCLAGRARYLRLHDLGYGDETGLPELRAAIIEHVVRARGVLADPEQVIVMPSASATIDLLARLRLADRPQTVWLEEPGYVTARDIFHAAGAQLVPVACDDEGLIVEGEGRPPPSLIYVTPSHQYPTGVAMSLRRRLALLDFAATQGAIVIEDDYDSEFHYASRPLAALQGIDRTGCVAYVGTFSKVLAPGLHVAYAVLPPALLDPARQLLRRQGGAVSIHVQAALADFLNEGHLRAHVRQMRSLYQARMAATREGLRQACGDILDIGAGDGGLQLAAWFRDKGADDVAAARFLHTQGIGAMALSPFHMGERRPGLLFGIAGAMPDRVAKLVAAMKR